MLELIQVEGELYNPPSDCHIPSPIITVRLRFQHGSHLSGMAPDLLVRIQDKFFCRTCDISELKIPKVSLFYFDQILMIPLIVPEFVSFTDS